MSVCLYCALEFHDSAAALCPAAQQQYKLIQIMYKLNIAAVHLNVYY